MFESSTTEFKKDYTDEIKKTVTAFANTSGGKIYIGIDDSGNVTGVNDSDEIILKCSNTIRDSIRPDITMFTEYSTEIIQDKKVVVINVQRGTSTPYYIESKGIRPAGIYVRQGASSVPASETAIIKMIKETDGDKYEKSRSLNQNLSFAEAIKEFAVYDVPFNDSTIRTLKLKSEDGMYTNLGLLLSDQCPHTIKAAVFEGDEKMTFRNRAIFSGSILKQINDAFEFIDKYNKTRSEFEGIHRIDIRDYPVEAIREALLNSVVHREYAFSSSILISIFDSRIEIVSIGGLAHGINSDEIYMGLSVQRNENLANVFYRLQLIEAFGTGIPKIYKLYEKYTEKPVIQVTENAFKITLPSSSAVSSRTPEPVIEKQFRIDTDEDVLRLIQYKKCVVRSDIEKAAGISQASASRILRRLLQNGKIIKTGKGKRIRYSVS